MNFFDSASATRSKNYGKPWHRLLGLVLFSVFGVFLFGFQAINENDAASNQQTSFGIIGACEHRGRGDQNYCEYTFPVGDEYYTGKNQANNGIGFGQTVVVYYDSQDPETNALEDFSEQSRKNMRLVYIFLAVLVVIVAISFWDGAPYRKTVDESTP